MGGLNWFISYLRVENHMKKIMEDPVETGVMERCIRIEKWVRV